MQCLGAAHAAGSAGIFCLLQEIPHPCGILPTRAPPQKKEMEFYQASRHTTNYQEIRGTGEHVNDTTEVHQPHPGCRRQQRRQSFFDSQRGKRYRGTTNKLKET